MGIKVQRTTTSDRVLKVVSLQDDSIDWAASYPDKEKWSEDDKKADYAKTHDLTKLRFLEDHDPATYFIFKHPERLDMAQSVRRIIAAVESENIDAVTHILNAAFIGTSEGLDGIRSEVSRTESGAVDPDYLQALEDSGLSEELAAVFMVTAQNLKREKFKKRPDQSKK